MIKNNQRNLYRVLAKITKAMLIRWGALPAGGSGHAPRRSSAQRWFRPMVRQKDDASTLIKVGLGPSWISSAPAAPPVSTVTSSLLIPNSHFQKYSILCVLQLNTKTQWTCREQGEHVGHMIILSGTVCIGRSCDQTYNLNKAQKKRRLKKKAN